MARSPSHALERVSEQHGAKKPQQQASKARGACSSHRSQSPVFQVSKSGEDSLASRSDAEPEPRDPDAEPEPDERVIALARCLAFTLVLFCRAFFFALILSLTKLAI
eukprot:Amastigsp_a511379_386.p4 type:complete len:107 gc:universal Amastigsp_a511379_386:365-685(+)